MKILSAYMLIRKIMVSPSVALGHAKALEISTAKYPIKRVVIKTTTVGAGLIDVTQEKLFSGQLPTRLIIGLVDHEAFNGVRTRNPFNFHHFNLNHIEVHVDGQLNQQIKPLKPNYTLGQYTEAYLSLFSGTNKINRDESNTISLSDYPNGYCLYCFDLTPDLSEDLHFNLIKQGSVRLALKFSTALARAITVITYAEFENIIEIDQSRNILFDFSS